MKLWKTVECDEPKAAALAAELDLHPAVARTLVARGYGQADAIDRFLNPRLSDMADPMALPGMEKAVAVLGEAVKDHWPMAVYGDYDVDGVTSTALLVQVLRGLGAEATPFLPHRVDDGYGLSVGALERCVERFRPKLVVTVDCGTCSVEAVEWAHQQGVEVVVTDHHEPAGALAPARAVVNPKLGKEDDTHLLAGVGVAFKLCHALVRHFKRKESAGDALPDLRKYLDWVAIGTICDVVPLRGENRTLARHGLDRLGKTDSIGLKALMTVAGVLKEPDSYHVAFVLGPRLNAAGRLGDAQAALDLLLTDDPARARALATQLDTANRERQKIEADTVEQARRTIDASFDPDKDFGLVAAGAGWHAGVIGIVASRICQLYRRPTVVITLDGEGAARGSCRSLEEFDMMEGLKACSGLLTKWGGHSMAAGVELPADKVPEFAKCFNQAAREKLEGVDLRPVVRIDAWIEGADISERLCKDVDRMRPFGLGNPRPVWGMKAVRIVGKPRVIKEKHLRFTVAAGNTQAGAIAFNMAAREVPDGPVDLAFHIQRNSFGGAETLELNIQDFQAAE